MITRYAWGEIWSRPGLQRRERSLITLTALIALGHDEELAMHVRAARTNGLTDDEIKELILQTAIYCGVPAANTAFRIAQRVLADLGSDSGPAPAGRLPVHAVLDVLGPRGFPGRHPVGEAEAFLATVVRNPRDLKPPSETMILYESAVHRGIAATFPVRTAPTPVSG
jgi:alkylhydroperoxidase/carboxymuconolactone decarboxylase family protein YurZ